MIFKLYCPMIKVHSFPRLGSVGRQIIELSCSLISSAATPQKDGDFVVVFFVPTTNKAFSKCFLALSMKYRPDHHDTEPSFAQVQALNHFTVNHLSSDTVYIVLSK